MESLYVSYDYEKAGNTGLDCKTSSFTVFH